MKKILILLVLLCSANVGVSVGASESDSMLMVRSRQAFPEAMMTLQGALKARGYQVMRVQRVDVGLRAKGYETDKYRVVFFAKAHELRDLSNTYPNLIPFLPAKISIYSEREQTVLVSENPEYLKAFFPDPALTTRFDRWSSDVRAVFAEVQAAD